MQLFPISHPGHMVLGHFLLKVVLGFILCSSLLGGEHLVAWDSIPPLSQADGAVKPTRLLQPEEIRRFILSPQHKSWPLNYQRENDGVVFADVYFDERRVWIDERLQGVFLRTVRLLAEEPERRLRIEGHCDPRGPSAYNFARADFHLTHLTHYLHQLGIQSHRISTINYGQHPLTCLDKNEQCQEDNLRAKKIFPVLSIGSTQRGCLTRLRLLDGGKQPRTPYNMQNIPSLQRIQIASPHHLFH